MSKRKEWILLITGFAGALLGTFGVLMFNTHVLSALPTILRIILYVVGYWIIAVVPLILMYANKEKMRDYFAGKEKLLWQIPHLAGFGNFVDNGTRHDKFIEFAIEFIYFVFSVSFVEEFVFRGFIFRRLKNITGNNVISLIVSSVLFGFLHVFHGNIIQVVITTLLGAFWCFCRLKIKNCSLLSVIIAHGIYDFMIGVWASVLLKP